MVNIRKTRNSINNLETGSKQFYQLMEIINLKKKCIS